MSDNLTGTAPGRYVNDFGTFGDTRGTNVTKSIIPTTKP